MSKSTQFVFKRSLIAVSIVSLSACSTMQNQTPDVVSGVGSTLAKAGKATANAGRKTWNTTTYLLGFTDSKQQKILCMSWPDRKPCGI